MIYEESLHMMLLRPRFTTPLQGTKLWGKWVFLVGFSLVVPNMEGEHF